MEEKTLHITSCLHPQRIRNKFTNEMVIVPCGKCEACITTKQQRLVQRLDMERLSWKYCVFTTLTYDNEHLPILKNLDKTYLVDVSPSRVHPIKGVLNINIEDSLHNIHRYNTVDLNKTSELIQLFTAKFGGVPYLSSVDIQRFIKRLRITLLRKYNKYEFQEKNSPSFRYFCCGEYGPSTYRPHYHVLLFFNSEFFAAHVQEFIRECWKFGYTDTSFVAKTNSSYVAGYCNSFAHLPALYQIREIRPFALYSKHPALGTLAYSSETLKSQFLSCDVTQCFLNTTSKVPLNVPLWRTFQDSLYPKLPYFGSLSINHRDKLYGICEKKTFSQSDRCFRRFVNMVDSSPSDYVKTYLDKMRQTDGNLMQKYYRWYSVCMRALCQSEVFGISVKEYIQCIEKFYAHKETQLLNSQYEFEKQYSNSNDITQIIGLDKQFWDSLSSAILAGYDVSDLDACEYLYIKSFEKLDLDLLFNEDLDVRRTYLYQLDFECSDEYLFFKHEKCSIYETSSKTKRKNDYLLSQTDDFYKRICDF